MTRNKYLSLFLILLITFIASAIGGFTTASFKEPWYSEITLPSFNPPSWVFAPVWTVLYVMMSLSIWNIWVKFHDTKILKVYFVHMIFNASWSVVFFGFHEITLALINLIIILSFVVFLTLLCFKKDRISFLLLLPYLFWVLFAFSLNINIVMLNT